MINLRFAIRGRRQFAMQFVSTETIKDVSNALKADLNESVFALKLNRQILDLSTQLSELSLTPESVILINPQVKNALVVQLNSIPSQSRLVNLPPRSTDWTDEQIQQKIGLLTNLGFPRADCERAIRSADFNVDRAVEYLISGVVPAN